MVSEPTWQAYLSLSPQELRAAADQASPAIASLLREMALSQESGLPLDPARIPQAPAALLDRVEVLAGELDLLIEPLDKRIGALRRHLGALQPARANALAHIQPLLEVVQDGQARGHLSQAIAQLSAGSDAQELDRVLNRLQIQIQAMPAALRSLSTASSPAPPAGLSDMVRGLARAEQDLARSQDSLYGASASLGLAASAAAQTQDPCTPWLLALRAGLVHALQGQALEAWEQAFDSATQFRTLKVAQLAAQALTPAAIQAGDYKRAALIQHLIAELTPPAARFHPRLQQALLLSKESGFDDSIDALLEECQRIVPMDIPSRARLWLTLGEIRERQGRVDAAKEAWQRLIKLPRAELEAPVLQARGLAFLGEVMLPSPKASRYLEAALERGEAVGDWATVASVVEAWYPSLRQTDPKAAEALARRAKDLARGLAPERLPDLDAWLS